MRTGNNVVVRYLLLRRVFRETIDDSPRKLEVPAKFEL